MLSLGTVYEGSLVFMFSKKPNEVLEDLKLVTIKWKTEELSVCSLHDAQLTPDNWYKIRMWHFINHGPNTDFDIVIEEISFFPEADKSDLSIQGIEFQPLEMHEDTEKFNSLSITDDDDDGCWEKKLPDEYPRYIEMSDTPLVNTTKKELYLRLCEGFLAHDGQLWISLCKSTRGICSMLSATNILRDDSFYEYMDTLNLASSRFKEVKRLGDSYYKGVVLFTCRLESPVLSPQYNYVCYLVFKFEDNHTETDDTLFFRVLCNLDGNFKGAIVTHFYWTPPMNIPTINDYRSLNIPRIEEVRVPNGHMEHLEDSRMKQREDGWMEVMLCKPLHQLQDHKSLTLELIHTKRGCFEGIIMEGIEFRPV